MILFLLFAAPIIGFITLYTLYPDWWEDKSFFSAFGRGFLWFWGALAFVAAISGGESGFFGHSFKLYLSARWLMVELPLIAASVGGFMLWTAVRQKQVPEKLVVSLSLVYALSFSLLSGFLEAVLWFKGYNGYVLFFHPLIGAARFFLISALFMIFINGDEWKRRVLVIAAAALFSLLFAVPPALSLVLKLKAAAAAVLLISALTLALFLITIKVTCPYFRRKVPYGEPEQQA
jgi:hypothetical protein